MKIPQPLPVPVLFTLVVVAPKPLQDKPQIIERLELPIEVRVEEEPIVQDHVLAAAYKLHLVFDTAEVLQMMLAQVDARKAAAEPKPPTWPEGEPEWHRGQDT